MQKIREGFHKFQEGYVASRHEFFQALAGGQKPMALFITCSDSRIDPNLITQTEPGELFVVRNAGNIVPPYGAANGGEGATIEYAVGALNIPDIIVCGHSHCGAMGALLKPESAKELPQVSAWLSHAEATRRIIRDNYQHLSDQALLTATVEENALVQIENLRTHPVVAARLAAGKLRLHAWVYKIETGEVFAYNPAKREFLELSVTEDPDLSASTFPTVAGR